MMNAMMFCIAMVGQERWNNDPDASVPIYSSTVEVQIPLEIETELTV